MSRSQPTPDSYKEELFSQFGRLGKALASPRRMELLDLLCQAERTVEELAGETGLATSEGAQRPSVLKGARLVSSRKAGQFVHYRLADPMVAELWQMMRRVAMQCLAEAREVVSSYLRGDEDLETVGHAELGKRARKGEILVLDVRPDVEYRAGHLPGAQSIPLAELHRRLAEIPADKEVIAYCRGPYCVMAIEAVRTLQANGYRARHLVDGVPEWRARGLRVENV